MILLLFPDALARVLRDGVRRRRRPDDAHSRGRLQRAEDRLLHGVRRARAAVPPREQDHLQVGKREKPRLKYILAR